MTITRRPATATEVLNEIDINLLCNTPVKFRRFVSEELCRKAKHGVRHSEYSRSKVRMIDGVPHVVRHGELHELTGTLCQMEGVRDFVSDLRIKSEYLKPRT